jgi:hypothetical protein
LKKAANSTEAAVNVIVMVSLAVKKLPFPTIASFFIRDRITRRVGDPVGANVFTLRDSSMLTSCIRQGFARKKAWL